MPTLRRKHITSKGHTGTTKAKKSKTEKAPSAKTDGRSTCPPISHGQCNVTTTDSSETDAIMGKNLTRFKEAWGQLSYCATASRQDLCYAESLLGQVSAGPRMRHWRLGQQVIQYAFNTKTYGIQPRTHGTQFRKTEPSSTFGESPLATNRVCRVCVHVQWRTNKLG